MIRPYDQGPIIACCSGDHTAAAIAVIRISGFEKLAFFSDVFSVELKNVKARYAHFCQLFDGEQVLDEIILTFFPGPNSYTGENVLELSVHGNRLNIRRILDFFCDKFAIRMAEAGEFTLRALKNKKMSLSQVEGLDLFLNAQSEFALDQGLSVLNGNLHFEYLHLKKLYLALLSAVELNIDFSEDVGAEKALCELEKALNEFKRCISSLDLRTKGERSQLLSPSLVIVGKTNAGKSSLFNEILQCKRAIVSPSEGTTRDYLSEYICFRNVNFQIIDTAGFRATEDLVEEEGIRRALEVFERAFFKILVLSSLETSKSHLKSISDEEFDLCVITHIDKKVPSDEFLAQVGHYSKKILAVSLVEAGGVKSAFWIGQNGSVPIELAKNDPIEATENGPIEPAKNGPIESGKNGPIESGKNGPIESAKNGPTGPAKNGLIELAKNGLIELAKNGPIESGKNGPIESAKNGPIESAKNGPIDSAKNGPIEPVKNGPIEPVKNGPIEPVKNGPIEPAKNGPIEPAKNGPIEPANLGLLSAINARRGFADGTEIGREILTEAHRKFSKLQDNNPITLERQAALINKIYRDTSAISSSFGPFFDIAVLDSELRLLAREVESLIGIVYPEDVLNNIFSSFCIGK